MAVIGKNDITKTTPDNILLGAGTYRKGLKFNTETQKWDGTIIGATSGGGKVEIKGNYIDIELDGASVLVKGLTVKDGGTASIEANFAELSPDTIKMGTNFTEGDSDAPGYTMLVDKSDIEEGDYVENFGFVGKTANGAKDIIVIFENALCKEGMTIEGKKGEASVVTLKMDAYAENDEGEFDTLPVKIYYPEVAVV